MIPGNDDAIRAVKLISGAVANAIIEGREGRMGAAAEEAEETEDAAEAEASRRNKYFECWSAGTAEAG